MLATARGLHRLGTLFVVAAAGLLAARPTAAANNPASLLWPRPREVRMVADSHLRLPIRVVAPAALAAPAALLRRELTSAFGPARPGGKGTVVRLKLAPGALPRAEEYTVEPSAHEVLLRAHDAQGAFWAVHTLVTLLGQARPTPGGYAVALPALRDWPDTQFRALMFQGAWVPSLADYKRTLELMARLHITYFALEFGPQVVLDFDPTMAQGGRFSKAEARAVIDYGRSLGLKPIAYLNLLGHLDRAYQKDPFTQHGGIDIRRDETYDKFVYPILSEMLDVYGPVEYFHCGMDEAWELFTWLSSQGEDVTGLIARHIARVDSFLKARGVKMVIWHDMLIAPSLADQIGAPAGPANGGPPQNTAAALGRLPKDVILDYWYYDPLPAYPALDYLQSQGFTVWASPWETPFSFVRYAQARKAPTFGTMWSDPPECFGSAQSSPVLALYAQAAWQASAAGPEVQPESALRPAAQQATNGVLWRRPTLTMPGKEALVLRPDGPRPASARDARYYGVPLATTQPITIAPLPEGSKPLAAAEAARVLLPGGVEVVLDGVNVDRGRRQMILYARPRERTGANRYGCEALVGPDGKVLQVYGEGSADHAIPADGFVLSAHGSSEGGKSGQLSALRPGDQVAVLDAAGNWIGGAEPIALSAELPGASTVRIGGADRPREATQVILYHPGYGDGQTPAGGPGVEVVVRRGRVAGVSTGTRRNAIPADGYVLSTAEGEGNPQAAALAGLHPGDTIRLLVEKGGKREYLDEVLAARSQRFPVRRRCAVLYLAVGSDRRSSPGTPLGEWQVKYGDGTVETIPVRSGREALAPEGLPVSLTDPVWLVDAPGSRFLVREWPNPHPGKTVTELVFVPAQTVLEVGARVLAVTAAVE
jgi:hypothetical protein